MKWILVFYALGLIILGCQQHPDLRTYRSVSGEFEYAKLSNALVIYNKADNRAPTQMGFLKGSFRSGNWTYTENDKDVIIPWTVYKDTGLRYTTNIFASFDSIIHTSEETRFVFSESGSSFFMSIRRNGSAKALLSNQSLETLFKEDFRQSGTIVRSWKNDTLLSTESSVINTSVYQTANPAATWDSFRSAYGKFGTKGEFFLIIVGSNSITEKKANILFDGVLAGFEINSKRIFNPMR